MRKKIYFVLYSNYKCKPENCFTIITRIIYQTSSVYFEFCANYLCSSWISNLIYNMSKFQNVTNPSTSIKTYVRINK
jgi:hypothetical protein